jgi:hypothetical protein
MDRGRAAALTQLMIIAAVGWRGVREVILVTGAVEWETVERAEAGVYVITLLSESHELPMALSAAQWPGGQQLKPSRHSSLEHLGPQAWPRVSTFGKSSLVVSESRKR